MVTPKVIANQFRRHGFALVDEFLSPDEVDHLQDELTRYVDQVVPRLDPRHVFYEQEHKVLIKHLTSPDLYDDYYKEMLNRPATLEVVQACLGTPAEPISSEVFYKHARVGTETPYHQDNAYFLCHPDDDVITAWIALDDVDESNGCLRYIEGSHLGPILNHEPLPNEGYNKVPAVELIDLKKETAACVKKGGVVFHHCKTLHTSHRNNSSNWRRGYATHWVSDRVVSENDTIKNGYFHAHEDLYQATIAELTSRSTSL